MSSRFKGMFDAVKDETQPTPKVKKSTKEPVINSDTTLPDPKPKQKRLAKSKDPNYVQALAYIKKDTLHNIKIALVRKDNLDFSELVEFLLSEWLKKKK